MDMALEITKQTIEVETCAGSASAQTLARAETLVPGAGREAIEVLLAEAEVSVLSAQAQAGRIVAEAEVRTQAAYRQGDETAPRALSARTGLSRTFEIEGVEPQMAAEVCARVEHVEAKYENGRMVFLVTVDMTARATGLRSVEVLTGVTGLEDVQQDLREICSEKTAAQTKATALLREEVPLPAAMDARTSLMDWGGVWVEKWEPDLGGVRVRGRVSAESLLSTGSGDRPAVAVKHQLEFDQLVEVPEWLCSQVCAAATLRKLESRVDQAEQGEDGVLTIEAEVEICVDSLATDCVTALFDAYAAGSENLKVERAPVQYCGALRCERCLSQVKGTLMLEEGAPGVGSVVCALGNPNISGWATNGESAVEGVVEISVLYQTTEGALASAQGEIPFRVECPGALNDTSLVCVEVQSLEAGALMSDRVDLRCVVGVTARTRREETALLATGVEEGEPEKKRPGIVLFWPTSSDSVWSIGQRYRIPVEEVRTLNGGTDTIEPGRAMVIRI